MVEHAAPPKFATLYWAYAVAAVDYWLEIGFPMVMDAFASAGAPLDKDLATAEALVAALAAGMVALEGLRDPIAARHFREAASLYAFSQGIPRELYAFYDEQFTRAATDEQRAEILGTCLLQRLQLPQSPAPLRILPVAVGTILWSQAIMSWRHVQDHPSDEPAS